jgi:hypothetical protein
MTGLKGKIFGGPFLELNGSRITIYGTCSPHAALKLAWTLPQLAMSSNSRIGRAGFGTSITKNFCKIWPVHVYLLI